MSGIAEICDTAIDTTAVHEAIESACKRIAPTWPIDEFIAVNPYWGFVGEEIQTAARRIESCSGSRMVMPRSYYRDQWRAGSFCAEDLNEALDRSSEDLTMSELLSELDGEAKAVPPIPLAIRLAWEHFAYLYLLDAQGLVAWTDAWDAISRWRAAIDQPRSLDWIFQEALEIAYQKNLCRSLKTGLRHSSLDTKGIAAVQAVFCIDVRSEVFRRAFEACSATIQTLGFAGFFGLPISYAALGSQIARTQLPGL